ncbi:copper resistance protein CopC [Nocardioides sp. GY 10113]|uniref:copper resistance CopC/CopD family protein n=1 Tax=Nocardioides sp. GY 10113 TaxID=2569761 RepID=UPI0014582FF7|nr:copper resistance protein CopC [Nocardioides sp. GY 10113]
MRRLTLALAVLVALVGVAGTAAPASAHASLVATDPADGAVLAQAPERATLTFDEPVSTISDGVALYDAAGEPLEVEAAARDEVVTADLPAGLADGSYVLTWRVVSDDGHPVAGSLTFSVGAPSARIQAPRSAADGAEGPLQVVVAVVAALNYLGLFVVGGLWLFLGWTTRGVRLHERARRRAVLLLRLAAALAVAAALLAVPLAGAYRQGLGLAGIVDPAAWELSLVRDDLVVAVLQALGLGAAVLASRQKPAAGSAGRRRPALVVDLLVLLAVASPALVGHTRAYEPPTLLLITDALHLLVGAVWLGGLVGLVVVLPSMSGRPRDAGTVLTRFSTLAADVLAALVGSGALLAWGILGSWGALVDTAYGRLLLVKVAVVAVVAAIAGWNRFVLLPRLSDGGHDQRRRAAGTVHRVVAVEASLLVVVLGVTGFLVDRVPGEAVAPPVRAASAAGATAVAGDYRVLAQADAVGGNRRRLTIQVQDETGEPVDLYRAPTLAVSSEEVDLGEVPLTPTGAGTYAADVVLPHLGAWELSVGIRVDRFTNPVATLDLTVD